MLTFCLQKLEMSVVFPFIPESSISLSSYVEYYTFKPGPKTKNVRNVCASETELETWHRVPFRKKKRPRGCGFIAKGLGWFVLPPGLVLSVDKATFPVLRICFFSLVVRCIAPGSAAFRTGGKESSVPDEVGSTSTGKPAAESSNHF